MPLLLKGLLLALLITGAAFDLRFRKIPNWLTVSGVVLGLAANALLSGWHGFVAASVGFLVAFAAYLPLYALRALGAGDVKLMAAVGSFTGAALWFDVLIATALLGGLAAVILVLIRRRFKRTFSNVAFILLALMHGKRPSDENPDLNVRDGRSVTLPHGAAIAAGALACLVLGKLG